MSEQDPFPQEVQKMQEFLCALIKTTDNALHLKSIIAMVLRIPQETPEMSQIHQIMMEYDKRFKKLEENDMKVNSDLKWIKAGIGGLGALIPIVQGILAVFGI